MLNRKPVQPKLFSHQSSSASIVLSSTDIVNEQERTTFEYNDPPPTSLRVTVPTWPINKSSVNSNTKIKVYLSRYFLDCVWRDTDRPDVKISSNSGTSVSKKMFVTMFVGDQGNIRLLKPVTSSTALSDFDFILTRNFAAIGEYGTNPYSTVQSSDITTTFENQYCGQLESFGQPGMYVGEVDSQALMCIQSNSVVTIRIVNDRQDQYRSIFWYNRFLTGVSLWNPKNTAYDVVPCNTEVKEYYKSLASVNVLSYGGPYYPTGLCQLAYPHRYQLHPFATLCKITNVTDPVYGELVVSNHEQTSFVVSQLGLLNSTDLSTIVYSNVQPGLAPSDEKSFDVPVYNPALSSLQVWNVVTPQTTNLPVRFSQSPTFSFPNGTWQGTQRVSQKTQAGTHSPFAFEQRLPQNVLKVVNDTNDYNVAYKNCVVPCHLYVFMDSGSSWTEDNNNTVTCGERAIQFNIGSPAFVNKLQLLFPRTQEDFQPVKVAVSAQRKYTGDIYHSSDVASAVWFGNYQHSAPAGSKSHPDTDKGCLYVNTHTQTTHTLYGGSTYLVKPKPTSTPSTSPYSGTLQAPVYSTEQRGGRKSVVVKNADSFVDTDPNNVNPAFDFYRQEYGPFVHGATVAELFDTNVVKGITFLDGVAEWRTKQFYQGHWFTDPVTFACSSKVSELLKGSVFVLENGRLKKATSTNDRTSLLNTGVQKYVYPVTFNDTVPNSQLLVDTFTSLADVLLNKFTVYTVNCTTAGSPTIADTPCVEYVVKESYYFAPIFNQYENNTTSSSGAFRPTATTVGQKLVRPEYAQSQYYGFTCGSFLDDTPGSHRYTRGFSNTPQVHSVRLCTQLFSFTTNQGQVLDTNSTKTATFFKNYDAGVLVSCSVDNPGTKYTQPSYDSSSISMYSVFPNVSRDVFVNPTNGSVLDRGEYLLPGGRNLDTVNVAATAKGIPLFTDVIPGTLSATVADDTNLKEYTYYTKAGNKTPLRRFAEFQIELVTS